MIIGWHKSIVSSDWSDTMVWFVQILLLLYFYHPIYMILGWWSHPGQRWSWRCNSSACLQPGMIQEQSQTQMNWSRIFWRSEHFWWGWTLDPEEWVVLSEVLICSKVLPDCPPVLEDLSEWCRWWCASSTHPRCPEIFLWIINIFMLLSELSVVWRGTWNRERRNIKLFLFT